MSRFPVSARRGPAPPPFNRQSTVTKEEIDELKRQKLVLLEERKQLRTRIARIEVQNKRGGAPCSRNKQLEAQLRKQQTALEQLLEDQHQQLEDLRGSDRATLCLELQEEAKILLQEQFRLDDVRIAQEAELELTQRNLDDLLESDGPEMLAQQKEKMVKLQEKIGVYRHANSKLRAKIKSLNQQKASANQSEVAQRAEELEEQIKKVREAIGKLEKKYEQSDAEHAEFMQKLREAPLD
jgi:chromosome segregation ATPase